MTDLPTHLVETPILRAGKTSDLRKRREHNILWIRDLLREGLEYGRVEKRILMHRTVAGEHLYIHYPGKESAETAEPRPWDFRPVVVLPSQGEGPDLTFGDIWNGLIRQLVPLVDEAPEIPRAIAALFYRMAFMVDHELTSAPRPEDVSWVQAPPSDIAELHDGEAFGNLYRYKPPMPLIDAISEEVPEWRGMSLEAFLHYNDILAWNEDCKYYYRDVEAGDDEWMGRTGRVNNLLTHISFVGFILRELDITKIASGLARLGVAGATNAQIEKFSGGLVSKERD